MYPRGLGLFGTGTFLRESLNLFARMSSEPTYRRKVEINRVIGALIRAGIWTKLDVLYVMAAHTSQAALLNWKGATYNATASGGTFTTDRGIAGDGASAYITTGYGPGDGQFLTASRAFGRVLGVAPTANRHDLGTTNGGNYAAIQSSATAYNCYDGALTDVFGASASPLPHIMVSRETSTDFIVYRDGASVGTDAAANAMPTSDFTLLALNNAGVPESFSDAQIQVAHFGAGLTAAQVATLNTALRTYLTSVGA